MTRTFSAIFIGLVTIFSFSGCASILNERTQRINIMTSSGDPVEVLIDGVPFQAPGIASISRAKSDKIITTKDPKCAASTLVPSTIDNIFWINVITGGVFGSTTDYATEKMWKYQDPVIVSCKK